MFSVSARLKRILPAVRDFKHRKNCHIPWGLPSFPLLDLPSPSTKSESPDLKKHLTRQGSFPANWRQNPTLPNPRGNFHLVYSSFICFQGYFHCCWSLGEFCALFTYLWSIVPKSDILFLSVFSLNFFYISYFLSQVFWFCLSFLAIGLGGKLQI